MAVQLLPHQEKAVGELADGKILCGGVGSGKSLTAIAYYTQAHPTRPLYIITTAKKRDSLDWQKELARYSLTTSSNVVIDSWNKISHYKEVKDAFFIFDEQRLVGSGAWVKSFLRIAKQNSWILLSATPGDTWMDYIPVFVANEFYKNRTAFIRDHVVYSNYARYPKVERYLGQRRLADYRKRLLVEMPMERHTVRVPHLVKVDHDAEMMQEAIKSRWNPYETRPMKDAGELYRVMRRVAVSHPSRLQAVRNILATHHRLIVFYNFNYELIALRSLSENVKLAEWNGQNHDPLPTTDSWVYLVQYTAGAEGWNCVDTDAMCFYSLPYSYKLWEQAHGRTDRLDTPFVNLHYYTLRSAAKVEAQIAEALSDKKDFNEREHWNEW